MPKLSNKKHKRKNIKRSNGKISAQAALDYLVSWGWVLIIIVLAIVVLFSLGIFKVPTAPTIINGFQGITMQAAEANSTMMVFKITNSYNQFVNITGVTVDVNNNNYTSYSCLNSLISTGQSTLCRVLVSIPTSSYISKIMIAFTPYKSNIYEVSNGTVSSALVSGSLPINNQLTYFVERGLPYGSTFTVNYNTSTNSTSVSSTNNKVSFNLPFGNYYFSIPSVSYQGCNSIPTPVSGYHSTGAADLISFRSNCTTTFTESGLPSNQQWHSNYDGLSPSASTGSPSIVTQTGITTVSLYTAEGYSNDLSCNSYNAPSISEGSSYAFSSWNCTTTFTESGLPSNQQWHSNYDGLSPSASTGSPSIVTQTGITTVSQYTAEGDSNDLSCNSYNAPSISEGSSYAFSSWNCTTTFIDDGFTSPLQNLSHQWTIKWNSVRGTSTSSIISFTNTGISNVATEPYQQPFTEGTVLCTGPSGSAYPGSLINLGIENTGSNWICDVIAISMSPNIIKFVPEFYPSNVILDSITVPSSNAFVSQYGMSGQLAYNPNTNEFYVPMPGDGAVALINASTATYLGSISFGSGVVIGTYYQNGLVFVLDSPSPSLHTNYSVLVINGNTPLKTNTTISYTASGFAYNAATNSFWIGSTALGANSIYVVAANSTANLIDIITASFINPQNSGYLTGPAAYDPNNHEMYVSGVTSDIGGAGEIQLFYSNGTAVGSPININSTTSNPGQVVYTPYSVKNTGGTDHIDVVGLAGFPPDSLTIIDDSTNTVTGSIALPSYSAQLFYDGAINSGFAFPGSDLYTFYCPYSSSTGLCDSGSILSSTFANDPGVGDVNLTLSNTGSENVSTLGGVITQPTTITFLESGLPSNIGWAASIAGYSFTSSTSYIIAPVAINGGYSYSFLINPICSGTTLYSSNATRGSASAGQVVKVEWTAKTNGCP